MPPRKVRPVQSHNPTTFSSMCLRGVRRVLPIVLVFMAGCAMTEVKHKAVSSSGVVVGGSVECCPAEEDRSVAKFIGNVQLTQYGPVAVCQDELANKVVPWTPPPDCDGKETVIEHLVGRRRLGHTVPILGWFGAGRRSEPGRYKVIRTKQDEEAIIAAAVTCFSVKDSITIDGVRFADDDIIAFDGGRVAKLIDGGDVGTGKLEIDAFVMVTTNRFLVSFASDFEVDNEHPLPGLTGMIRDEDVLLFEASSLGESTRGVYSIYIDGSDIGLSETDIDAMSILDSGELVCSVDRRTSLGKLNVHPSDLLKLELHQAGTNTHATWTVLVRAKDVALEAQNVDAIDFNDDWFVSTERSFLHNGRIYDQADVFSLAELDTNEDSSQPRLIDHRTVMSLRGTSLDGHDVTSVSCLRAD